MPERIGADNLFTDMMEMNDEIHIRPVARFKSPFSSKFGIPRQGEVVEELVGQIVFCPEFSREEAVRGLEGFDYLWLIWGFSGNDGQWGFTVRPPRLGGNRSVGVFASRSPFRPNGLGLSSVKILHIDAGAAITVGGADLMDGTPIYDIKPYVRYADSHPEARSGFADDIGWKEAEVTFPVELQHKFLKMRRWTMPNHDRPGSRSPETGMSEAVAAERMTDSGTGGRMTGAWPGHDPETAGHRDVSALIKTLAQRPVPPYAHTPGRIYGMPFMGCDIRFRIDGDILTVTEIEKGLDTGDAAVAGSRGGTGH